MSLPTLMMRLVGISGGGWGSPGLRLLLAFAKATHRLSDRSVLRRFTMKKLIIILLMMAGSAHAADPYCDVPLTRASKELETLASCKTKDDCAESWAKIHLYKMYYALNICDPDLWNVVMPQTIPLDQKTINAVRQAIKPQTFR